MHVSVKPKFHTHKECGQRFHPLLHTSYTWDCLFGGSSMGGELGSNGLEERDDLQHSCVEDKIILKHI